MRRWVVGAATAFAVVAIVVLNASPLRPHQLVFAGWQPHPTAADPALAAAAAAPCASADPTLTGATPVAQDQRGTAATFLFLNGADLSICVVARDETGEAVAAATGSSHLAGGVDALSVDTGMSMPAHDGFAGLTVVAGRVDGSVSRIEVARDDGTRIEATVSGGYFVAWWPTAGKAVSVAARNSDGKVVREVGVPF